MTRNQKLSRTGHENCRLDLSSVAVDYVYAVRLNASSAQAIPVGAQREVNQGLVKHKFCDFLIEFEIVHYDPFGYSYPPGIFKR